MTTTTFDTLSFSKTLQDAGMPQAQADALATAQKSALEQMVATRELVTRHDLYIALADTRHELLKWMMGMLVAQTALIVTAFGIGIAILK